MAAQQLFDVGGSFTDPDGVFHATFSGFRGLPAVTGAPYSADTVVDATQQSGRTQHIARDSKGRVRIEQPMSPAPSGVTVPTLVQIFDPVGGFDYILDNQNKVAHRIAVQTPAANEIGPGGGGVESGVPVGNTGITATIHVIHPNQPARSVEQLGTRTIEGVSAEGTRRTTTWPAGSQGNDHPLIDVMETWYSPELKAMVLSKTTSARNGDSTVKLTNISRAEPDAALFQPPPGYTIVDDRDSVTLNLKRQ
jgi:hypothetical protein